MDTRATLKCLAGLAHDRRLAIFRLLVGQGPSGIAAGQIAERLGMAPATTSFHLKELAHADLVVARSESRYIFYSANYTAMNELIAYLTDNCCRQSGACLTQCAPPRVAAANSRADGGIKRSRRAAKTTSKRRAA